MGLDVPAAADAAAGGSALMNAPNVSVVGASSCGPEVVALGEELGELLAQCGCTVFCGGMSGVMEAVARGARRGGGVCVGILPTLDRRHAAPDLTLSICTGVGHARNLAVVASGDVVIAVGGAWGTLSEIGLARSIGRQVVLLESWSVTPAASPGEAALPEASSRGFEVTDPSASSAASEVDGPSASSGASAVDGLIVARSATEAVDLALAAIA